MLTLRSTLTAAAVAAGLIGGISAANAAVVFSDDFESYAPVLNANLAPNWTIGGSVDIIGIGTAFNLIPGQDDTHYVDLDGSTQTPGTITTTKVFGPGTYTISFDLAGQNRAYDLLTKTTTVTFDGKTASFPLVWNAALATYTWTVTTSTAGTLSFSNSAGGNDNVGDLLDNVSVSTVVPEASTWAMLVAGFAGLGFAAFRGRKTPLGIA